MVLWFSWACALLLIVFVQLALKHYGDDWRQAMEWLLPAILPTTTLVCGVWASETARSDRPDRAVPQSAFRMAAAGSVVYLGFVTLVIAAQPFYDGPPVELMQRSALFLAPLQGVVGAFIGIFFSQTAQRAAEPPRTAEPQRQDAIAVPPPISAIGAVSTAAPQSQPAAPKRSRRSRATPEVGPK